MAKGAGQSASGVAAADARIGAEGAEAARGLCEFLDSSWTSYHAVATCAASLVAKGFVRLDESRAWPALKRGGRYFYTRNTSSLVAFVVGGRATAGCGVAVVGAHTDSPCPKLKPLTKLTKSGHMMVACQPYGGGLWHTWFDRDLGIAGRIICSGASKSNGSQTGSTLEHRLVKIDKPIMRIPTLAIHLDRGVNTEGMKVNVQNHLQPLLAMATSTKAPEKASGEGEGRAKEQQKHHPLLLQMLAEAAGCLPEDIKDFELQLCPTEKAAIGGALDEFIFSGRLDNLAMSYCALRALEASAESPGLVDELDGVMMIALFDHEEVGSSSAQGAGSPIMGEAVKRVTSNLAHHVGVEGVRPETEPWSAVNMSLRRSMVVSADMAHAVHPNYSDKHDSLHMPKLGDGVVIKHNANQRYSSDAVSSFMFRETGAREGCTSQDFVIRSDMACGSTIGPIVSANTGIRTVDVGIPQLSMHSVREMCHVKDIQHSVDHFKAFYKNFWALDDSLEVDGALLEQMPTIANDVGCEHLH